MHKTAGLDWRSKGLTMRWSVQDRGDRIVAPWRTLMHRWRRMAARRRYRRLARAAKAIGVPAAFCWQCGSEDLRVIRMTEPGPELWCCAGCGDVQERMVRSVVRISPTTKLA
jgi:hypothetical protein